MRKELLTVGILSAEPQLFKFSKYWLDRVGGALFLVTTTTGPGPIIDCCPPDPWYRACLLDTPMKLLNASVVFLTRAFSEPMRRKPKSFSTGKIDVRLTFDNGVSGFLKPEEA